MDGQTDFEILLMDFEMDRCKETWRNFSGAQKVLTVEAMRKCIFSSPLFQDSGS